MQAPEAVASEPVAESIESGPGGPAPPPSKSLRGRLFGRLADYARRYLTASVDHRLVFLQASVDGLREDMRRRDERVVETLQRLEANLDILSHSLAKDALSAHQRLQTVADHVDAIPSLFGPRFDELEIKIRPLIAFDEASYAVRLRDGYAMVPRDEPIFAVMVANATSGGLEPGTRRVLKALIQPGMSVADVGANVGLLTLPCAVATGPTGRVYAFEPEAGPRAQLEKTAYLNDLKWLEIHALAVGAATGKQTFHVSPVIGHSSLYALPQDEVAAGRDIEVQVTRLDDIIPPGAPLDVVKIDVEGAELDVLSGMSRLLAENPDMALIAEYGPSHLARIGIAPETWLRTFFEAGFKAYVIEEPTGVCRTLGPADLADVISVNLAFVRADGMAETRLPQ